MRGSEDLLKSLTEARRRAEDLESQLAFVREENRALEKRLFLEQSKFREREADLERQLQRIRRVWGGGVGEDQAWKNRIEEELALLREVHPLRDYLIAVEGELRRVELDLARPGWSELESASLKRIYARLNAQKTQLEELLGGADRRLDALRLKIQSI